MLVITFVSNRCKRCEDPTEGGTYVSALRCRGCPEEGKLLCRFGEEENFSGFVWKCDRCGREVEGGEVEGELEAIKNKIRKTSYLEPLEVQLKNSKECFVAKES